MPLTVYAVLFSLLPSQAAAHEAQTAATASGAAGPVAAAAAGKVKGLFCVVPRDLVHTFCVHGLGIQPLLSQFSGDRHTSPTKLNPALTDVNHRRDIEFDHNPRHPLAHSNALRIEFRNAINTTVFANTPWYYYPLGVSASASAASSPVAQRDSGPGGSGAALRPMVLSPGLAERQVMGVYSIAAQTQAQAQVQSQSPRRTPARPSSSAFLRFYRHSTPLSMLRPQSSEAGPESEGENEYGECYIALCRVFVLKLKTLSLDVGKHNVYNTSSELRDVEIQELIAMNYDAIYLQKS